MSLLLQNTLMISDIHSDQNNCRCL